MTHHILHFSYVRINVGFAYICCVLDQIWLNFAAYFRLLWF